MQLTFDDYVAQFDKDKSVRWIEPMSAHEIDILNYSPTVDEFAELKYDGHRGLLHFGETVRCFSRVVSKKSGWFSENTANVPHIEDMAFPEMYGTILDGEFDYGNTSMGVQSVMGALPEKAIAFQEENGYIPFKAFDIIYYKGINVQRMPLWKRKVYLALAVKEIWDKLGEESTWYLKYAEMNMTDDTRTQFYKLVSTYFVENEDEEAVETTVLEYMIHAHINVVESYKDLFLDFLDKELEGIMLKSMFGTYEQKRSKNYLKVKGVSTWDCVVMGYTPPTKVYDGKELHKWKYWEADGELVELDGFNEAEKWSFNQGVDVIPITKPYYMGWCGAIEFGVWKEHPTYEDVSGKYSEEKMSELVAKGFLKRISSGGFYELVHVGDCKGLSEKNLELIRTVGDSLIGTVLEVKANGILDIEKGSLRHPRFKKWRNDKTSEMCWWDDHLRNLGGIK